MTMACRASTIQRTSIIENGGEERGAIMKISRLPPLVARRVTLMCNNISRSDRLWVSID